MMKYCNLWTRLHVSFVQALGSIEAYVDYSGFYTTALPDYSV